MNLENRGKVEAIEEVTRVALYRGLRELVTNARQAGTSRARVALRTGTDVSLPLRSGDTT